ncbi:MAG: hypothetical protein SWK76_11360 [Actinomycetota bacterium]|nr:hypothetical protein [Actinomycetota bacterium]
MKKSEKQTVIPYEAIPEVGSYIHRVEGKDYLVMNDSMYTFYRRSMGEFSPFFLGLRDEKRILGCRCSSCGIVRIPPFLTRCPDCDFAPTELVEVGEVGKMINTPPITYFANSLFQQQVPSGRGRIVLEGADTAMSINFYTTKGILVPGIVGKGTEMKVVFRDQRVGEITDIFCVPTSELSPEQVSKTGLQESELDWEKAQEPKLPEANAEDTKRFKASLKELKDLVDEMNKCERARQDIDDWRRIVQVETTGGEIVLEIDDGDLRVSEGRSTKPDFTLVCKDIDTLLNGLAYRGSLTQAIITKNLWISVNREFTTIFKLERMARSLVKSKRK